MSAIRQTLVETNNSYFFTWHRICYNSCHLLFSSHFYLGEKSFVLLLRTKTVFHKGTHFIFLACPWGGGGGGGEEGTTSLSGTALQGSSCQSLVGVKLYHLARPCPLFRPRDCEVERAGWTVSMPHSLRPSSDTFPPSSPTVQYRQCKVWEVVMTYVTMPFEWVTYVREPRKPHPWTHKARFKNLDTVAFCSTQ